MSPTAHPERSIQPLHTPPPVDSIYTAKPSSLTCSQLCSLLRPTQEEELNERILLPASDSASASSNRFSTPSTIDKCLLLPVLLRVAARFQAQLELRSRAAEIHRDVDQYISLFKDIDDAVHEDTLHTVGSSHYNDTSQTHQSPSHHSPFNANAPSPPSPPTAPIQQQPIPAHSDFTSPSSRHRAMNSTECTTAIPALSKLVNDSDFLTDKHDYTSFMAEFGSTSMQCDRIKSEKQQLFNILKRVYPDATNRSKKSLVVLLLDDFKYWKNSYVHRQDEIRDRLRWLDKRVRKRGCRGGKKRKKKINIQQRIFDRPVISTSID